MAYRNFEDIVNVGEFTERITLLQQTQTSGAAGDIQQSWTFHSTKFAKVEMQTTDEQMNEYSLESRPTLVITTYLIPANNKWRIVYDGKEYDITSINKIRNSPYCEVRATMVRDGNN